MPILQARTREEIRVAIGHNLGAVELITAAVAGSTTTFLADGLFGGNDDHNGKWIQLTGPTNNDGVTARVVDSAVSDYRTTLTVFPAITAPALNDTAELWDMRHDPARIHEFINQAIIEATGHVFDPEESVALHGDSRTGRFDIPTEFAMLTRVDVRGSVESKVIHSCGAVWDEKTDADFTVTVDTKDYKHGSALKIVIAATAAAADSISDSITSINLSGYDYVEFWIKSTMATAAGDLQLLLDNTASVASPLETLDVPALVANTWTFCRVALANPRLDTAIISVGLSYTTDIGAATVWLDDIRAALDSSATWVPLDRHLWQVDQEARDLILTIGGVAAVGYRLMKLVGGDKPALLSADATASEIDDQYIIARATALALMAASGGPNTDPDALRQAVAYWEGRAQQAKGAFPMLVNCRVVG